MLSMVFGTALLYIAIDDICNLRVRNWANALVAALGALDAFWQDRLLDAASGAVLGFALVYGVAALYRRWRGRDGMGMGDVKLMAAGGMWLGPLDVPMALLMACASALLAVIAFSVFGHASFADGKIPFAPFLAFGIFAAWMATGLGWI